MDTRRTEVKDLPNYPGAHSVNIQYGPMGEIDMFTTTLMSRDSTDKIAAFYDKVIKTNGWTVTNRIVDPEYCEWALKKNDSDEAKITVTKSTMPNVFAIVIGRTGKPPQATSATPPKL